jgi:hypothetical protein
MAWFFCAFSVPLVYFAQLTAKRLRFTAFGFVQAYGRAPSVCCNVYGLNRLNALQRGGGCGYFGCLLVAEILRAGSCGRITIPSLRINQYATRMDGLDAARQ